MEIGDRMKNYEHRFRYYLNRRTPTIIRIDGKAFHTFTRGLNKPYDYNLIQQMQLTAQYLCENIDGCILGYVQSDEISLLLIDYKKFGTQGWFDYNLQKIVSVSASMAAAFFNSRCVDSYDKLAVFDSRAFQIADPDEVGNYFRWRERDWNRNSVSMLAQSMFSHKELHGKNVSEMHEMCHARGVNWASLPDVVKNGTWLLKENSWAPLCTQWDYMNWIREKVEYSNYE